MTILFAGPFLVGLILFFFVRIDWGRHNENFTKTKVRPFKYCGQYHAYPVWLNLTSFISIALMTIGSGGLALLMLMPTMLELKHEGYFEEDNAR